MLRPCYQYLDKIWNVVNWEEGEKRYNDAIAASEL